MAGKFYVGPVEIMSGLVKVPITSIQILGFGNRFWDFLGFVRPVRQERWLPCLVYVGGISYTVTVIEVCSCDIVV